MKTKMTIPIIAAVIAVVSAFGLSSFKKSAVKPPMDYWVYTPTTTGFADTSKYIKVSLSDPSDQNCPSGTVRPCVYKLATGSLSTKAGLYTDLHALSTDPSILAASTSKKSN